MAMPSSQQVLEALGGIKDPDLGRDVVSLGMIKELEVSPEGKVSFTFELTTPACPVRDRFKSQAEDAVGGIAGVTGVEVRMTANVRPAFLRPKPSEILPGVKQTIAVAPGKGDASLTLAQVVPLTGVAIVCTPQDVATDIAVKALQMFRKLNVTPLGLIENMSWYVCPECGHRHEIFSHGGAEAAAKRLGVPFLGAIPLEEGIREDADSGTPVVISRPESAGAKAFVAIASQVAARTSIQSFRQLPVINVH